MEVPEEKQLVRAKKQKTEGVHKKKQGGGGREIKLLTGSLAPTACAASPTPNRSLPKPRSSWGARWRTCSRPSGRHRRILIGKDTRLSGYMLETAMASGICSMGVDVWLVGPLPTPGIAFLTRSMRADAGVVISASHNPFQDNGIKFFSREGFKLDDETERRIEELVFDDGALAHLRASAGEIGKAARIDDALGRYLVFLKTCVPRAVTFDGLKVVIDCANGAAYKVGSRRADRTGRRRGRDGRRSRRQEHQSRLRRGSSR